MEYATKDAAAYLLSKAPIYLGKRRLTVKPKAAKARKTMKCELEANMKQPSVKELEGAGAKTEREAKHTALMSRLITCKDVSTAVSVFLTPNETGDDVKQYDNHAIVLCTERKGLLTKAFLTYDYTSTELCKLKIKS